MIGLIVSIIIVLLLIGLASYIYRTPVPKPAILSTTEASMPPYPKQPTLPALPNPLPVVPDSKGRGVYQDAQKNWFVVNADFKGTPTAIAGPVIVDMSIGKDYFWAVNTDQNVYRKPISGGDWEKTASQHTVKIDANEKGDVWMIINNGQIYRSTEQQIMSSAYFVPGILSEISLGSTKAFGINSADYSLYWCPISNPGQWTNVPGEYRSVEAGGGQVYWATKDFKIYRTTEDKFPNDAVLVPGKAIQVSAGKDRVWAMSPEPETANSNMFSCTIPCAEGDWQKIDGHVLNMDLAR